MHSIVIDKDLKKMKSKFENGFRVKFSDILLKKFPMIYVYELFNTYGFKDFESIYLAIKVQESGKEFLSDNFKLLIDREYICLSKKLIVENDDYKIDQNIEEIYKPIQLKFFISSEVNFIKNSYKAFLDFEKITFPLILRKWQKGDSFYPLGMKNKKKLSDFFIDEKLSIYDKANVWLLCSNNDIIWVIGYRIDDRYKITDNTKKMYIANLLN
jgi:tRNA(Ile)-lysidine synthase